MLDTRHIEAYRGAPIQPKSTSPQAAYPFVPGQGPHPALALVRWAALASVADYLRTGQRSVQGWLRQQGAQAVLFTEAEDATAFANANSPQDLQQLALLCRGA